MTQPPSALPLPPRRGVTLLELLVVLAIMGIAAAAVVPALRPARDERAADPRASLLADARRTAVQRGEPLRMRLDADGVWAVVTDRDGTPIRSGRIALPSRAAGETQEAMDVRIDAMGTCTPVLHRAETSRDGGSRAPAFDMLRCAFDTTGAQVVAPP